MTPETLMYDWFEQVWTQKQEDAIDRMMAPHAVIHDLPTTDGSPMQGPSGFKPFHRRLVSAFPDLRVEVVRTMVDGDTAVAHCRVTLTHSGDGLGVAATGRPATFSGVAIARVENGQIVEGWNCFDFLSMYQQLGLLPALA